MTKDQIHAEHKNDELKSWDFEVGLIHGADNRGVLTVWMSYREAARAIVAIGNQFQESDLARISLAFCGQLGESDE